MPYASPLIQLPRLGAHLKLDLWAKRDDLLPLSGGGNKARKMWRIAELVETRQCNAIVTTGGIQSNHARAAALLAAQKGWKCKLILHSAEALNSPPTGNLLLMQLTGAEIEVVSPEQISESMKCAMEELRFRGYAPYEIPGGGHCIAGGLAYVEAIDELNQQLHSIDWFPEHIVLASGTGTTQAGIVVGLENLGIAAQVHGISVARKNPRGSNVLSEMCSELRMHLGLTSSETRVRSNFWDNWIGDGYERASKKVLETIRLASRLEGLILDPTYTGKAFTGLIALVEQKEIPPGSKVLFWHTGGLLNLMASRYSFAKSV